MRALQMGADTYIVSDEFLEGSDVIYDRLPSGRRDREDQRRVRPGRPGDHRRVDALTATCCRRTGCQAHMPLLGAARS